jgi:adenosylcobinamide-GDP ribazoletransferase
MRKKIGDWVIGDLRVAFAFLTILPAGHTGERPPGYAFAWFPLVGLVIGFLLYGAALVAPAPLAGYVVLLLWAIITGALHLDGFGDACDGLLATTTPQRRLEIMKDPRTGAWAVVGLILLLLGKFVAVGQVAPLLLVVAPTAGRWSMVVAASSFPYARTAGLGGYFREGLGRRQVIVASVTELLVTGAVAYFDPRALLALIVAPLLVFAGGRWAASRLGGGLTGDVYGGLCELTELIFLLGCVWLGA